MANMEERLQAVVSQAETDGAKWHTIIHGNNTTTVPTENGNVPTVAKQMKDVHDEVVNGIIDYMTECQTARDVAIQTKNETIAVKNETNSQFRMMQADMYNLYPSVGAVNAIRSNYNFAELPEDVDFIIDACNFKVLGHKVEPADMSKGEIARTYLYFDSEYQTYNMSKQLRRLMDAWNVLYPVTPWECTRAKRIEEIQGNPNPFVKEPCIEKGLY